MPIDTTIFLSFGTALAFLSLNSSVKAGTMSCLYFSKNRANIVHLLDFLYRSQRLAGFLGRSLLGTIGADAESHPRRLVCLGIHRKDVGDADRHLLLNSPAASMLPRRLQVAVHAV